MGKELLIYVNPLYRLLLYAVQRGKVPGLLKSACSFILEISIEKYLKDFPLSY